MFTRLPLFGRHDFTCRRNTILLASCISLSSCSWWASSCSSHDFSSSWASCPREGHSPQRATSSERTGERQESVGESSVSRRGNLACCFSTFPNRSTRAAEPTCWGFLLRRLRFVTLRFPTALLIGSRLLFRGVGALGDDILLFGGMRGAGGAETETDGNRQDWVCLYLLPNEWQ